MLNAQDMPLDAFWRFVVWLYHGGGLRASMVPFWRRGGMPSGGGGSNVVPFWHTTHRQLLHRGGQIMGCSPRRDRAGQVEGQDCPFCCPELSETTSQKC